MARFKLTPEKICSSLDKTLIVRVAGVCLYYSHSQPRGYWLVDENLKDRKVKFTGGSMVSACRDFNASVAKALKS